MMGTKLRIFAPQINVSLEELVPQDHFYRHLERQLDLSFVRSFVEQNYAGTGRPSIDPVVFFKLQLVMFFEGIRSERQLIRQAADRLSVRWYLGYDLGEPLPDHSSLTRIRTRYGVEVFRRFFDAIVDQCQQAGLVWGKELYADATKVGANAALSSMQPRFAVEAHLASLFSQETNENEEVEKEHSPSEMGSPSSLPSKKEEGNLLDSSPVRHLPSSLDETLQEELTQANSHRHDWIERGGEPERDTTHGQYQRLADFWVSTTDPDATMMNKKGGGTQLGYHTHYVVDGGKARIILAALVTPSEVMENQPVLDLLWRVRFRWKLWPRQFTGDTTYGTAEIINALEQQQIRPFVPLPDFDQRTEFFGQHDFHYDAQRDLYICPTGAELHVLPSGCTDQFKQYRAKASTCNACPLKSHCTTSSTGRRLSRHVAEEAFERVRAFHLTDAYKKAINKRKVWVEPLFAEAKDWHGMRRFRLRRLWRVNCEALMKAAGQNLKRLLQRRGWGRRPWPQGNASALSEPPSEDRLQMPMLTRAQQALACEQDQLVKGIFKIFFIYQSYFSFFCLSAKKHLFSNCQGTICLSIFCLFLASRRSLFLILSMLVYQPWGGTGWGSRREALQKGFSTG
jgi:transposase